MVNRLSMAGNEIDFAGMQVPFTQGLIHKGSVHASYPGIQSAKGLLVNSPFSKDLAYAATEFIRVRFRAESDQRQPGLGASSGDAAKRNIQTVERGARHEAQNRAMAVARHCMQ